MSQPVRVIVVDDSAMVRRLITDLLERDPDIRVVATARNGREAISAVEQHRPDIVTMDVRMPVMDGLAATEHLMAFLPTPILVLTASLSRYDVDITFKMLGAGALEVFEKPAGGDAAALERIGNVLRGKVKLLARVRVVTHLRGRRGTRETLWTPSLESAAQSSKLAPKKRGLERGTRGNDFPVVVIGASTGGPRIVYQILSELPSNLQAAVLIVQHIAKGFSAGMTSWLRTANQLPTQLAAEGMHIQPGTIYVAPEGQDLLITKDGEIHLYGGVLLLQRPSVDVTMQAAAEVFGSRVVGVLLTGMGRDGAYGMLTIKRAGGYTIAQDEATSAIFGMPRAAIQLGAAMEVLPTSQIATRIISLVREIVDANAED